MTLIELGTIIGKTIEFTGLDVNGHEMVQFSGVDVKEGAGLVSDCGRGITKDAAVLNYAFKLAGKLIVVDAHTDNRVEMQLPATLKS